MNATTDHFPPSTNNHRSPHPIAFMFLILPFGIISGYLSVTLAYLFSKSGISVEQVSGLAAAALIPQIFKFLWGPLVDGTLTLKKWYIIACFATALGILATAFIPIRPGSLPLLTGVIILSHFVVSFVALSANGLAAHDTPPDKQGRVSGFMQAGYMGGTGVGGGAGLWLAQHLPAVWMAGGVLALCCLLCCFALFFVNEPVIALKVKDIGATLVNVVKDVWDTLKTKLGVLAMILSFLPIGTCAAGLLFAAIAKDWNTGANVVALIPGC